MEFFKINDELAADIRARVKAFDFGAIEKIKKAKADNGTFDVIISTEDIDRSGEIVRQNGWELTNYKNNPIVLWGHDYYNLPIGVCLETYQTEKNGVPATGAKGVFLSADINPFAQQVRKLYEFGLEKGEGVGCTTSVGFIPKEFDEGNRAVITKAELLEFSFVPVPANHGVGPARGRSITFAEARALGIDTVGMRQKGVQFADTVGFIPNELAEKSAPEDEAWTKPTLKDFTDKEWADLSDTEKTHIAGHFAYSPKAIPEAFEDLKLPYRRATDGVILWKGLKSAMGDLLRVNDAVDVEDDRKAVYDHLAAFFKLFGKDAPEFKAAKEAQAGDTCTLDDGSDGTFTTDDDGKLICTPAEDKSKAETGGQKTLIKTIGDEHSRHTGEVEKALDALDGTDAEHLKDFRSAIADEQTMHRAKSVAALRAFDASEDKAFDKKPFLKSLRDEHDNYDAKTGAALDDFEKKCMKSVKAEDTEGNIDALEAKMEDNQRAHKKAIVKIAKSMCKEAYGEEDQADEKTIAILNEFLAPHISSLILPAVVAKIGARMSAESKNKLGEAHEHMKAAKAILEGLHGGLADGDGEEKPAEGEGKTAPAPVTDRSKTRTTSRSEDPALQAHLRAREIVGGIEAVAREALGQLNADIRNHGTK